MTDDTGGALTDEERALWDVDPDEWAHTPPFHVFRALMDEDDNTWWRAGSGHGLNAYDAAIDRVEDLEVERDDLARRLDAVRKLADKWTSPTYSIDGTSVGVPGEARYQTRHISDDFADRLRAALASTDADHGRCFTTPGVHAPGCRLYKEES